MEDTSTIAGGIVVGIAIPLVAFGSVASALQSSGDSVSESMFWATMVVAILGVGQLVYIVPLAVMALYMGQRARLRGLMIAAAIVGLVFVGFAIALVGFGDWRGFA